MARPHEDRDFVTKFHATRCCMTSILVRSLLFCFLCVMSDDVPMSHKKVVETFGKPTPPGKERRMNRRALENELKSIANRPDRNLPQRKRTKAGKPGGESKAKIRRRLAAAALVNFTEAEKKRLAKERYQHPTRGGTLASAADAAGVTRATIERWIIEDPNFREEMIEAHETVIDRLETMAFRRAKGTRDVPGSDDLLKFLLRANRPKFAAAAGAGGVAGSASNPAALRAAEEESKQQALKQKFKIAGQEIEF